MQELDLKLVCARQRERHNQRPDLQEVVVPHAWIIPNLQREHHEQEQHQVPVLGMVAEPAICHLDELLDVCKQDDDALDLLLRAQKDGEVMVHDSQEQRNGRLVQELVVSGRSPIIEDGVFIGIVAAGPI